MARPVYQEARGMPALMLRVRSQLAHETPTTFAEICRVRFLLKLCMSNANLLLRRWDEEAVAQIQHLLDCLDVARIDQSLKWAKDYIEKIENTGAISRSLNLASIWPRF